MKLMHIADLHFGKMLHGIPLAESGDQRDWVDKFLELVRQVQPDAILIAGDVYDRVNPTRASIQLAGYMFSELSHMDKRPAVMVAAGNHDAGQMIDYLGDVIENDGIYVSGVIERAMKQVTLRDEYGEVVFHIAPYAFPAEINRVLDIELRDYNSAYIAWLCAQDIDFTKRNVIISHQNMMFSGHEAERGGSETMVGGLGGIDAGVLEGFEYAALGHIHAAQPVGSKTIRYGGSPLCYHFDELRHPQKGPVLIELGAKGTEPVVTVCPIEPLHPLRDVSGTLAEIIDAERDSARRGEYIRVTLAWDKDSKSIPDDAAEQLDALFEAHGSKVLSLRYAHAEREEAAEDEQTDSNARSLEERFIDFWSDRRGGLPDRETLEVLEFIARQEAETADEGMPTDEDGEKVIDFMLRQEDETK